MNDFFKKIDVRIYLSLLVYVTIVYLVISPDSYLYDAYHCDSAVFFMCGKAWMNGMTPYVDFADSKGPLLWLIYGIGYLISHYNYIGMFWLGCICYSFVLFFCYKIGHLLTNDIRLGYATSIIMNIPYFFNFDEPKAETWCYLPVVASLYYLLKEILCPTKQSSRTAGTVFGLSFMAAMLMKWSIGVMMLSFATSGIILLLRRKQSVTAYCLCFATSAALLLLPFAVYMLATNCFDAFVHEYFMNTSRTVGGNDSFGFLLSYWDDFTYQFAWGRKAANFLVYVFYVVMIFFYYRKHRNITILPLLCGIFFLALSIKHARWDHYKMINASFAIFFVLYIVEILAQYIRFNRKILAMTAVASMFAPISVNRLVGIKCGNQDKSFYDAAYVMSQRKNPTIINQVMDWGIGIGAHTLPGTRYWIGQHGATDEMKREALRAVDQRQADFVLARENSEMEKHAIRARYQYYLTCSCDGYKLYGPKGLRLPPKDFNVNHMDILLKRKIKFAD